MLTAEAVMEIRKIMEDGQSTEILLPALDPGVYYTHVRGAGGQPLEKHVSPLGQRVYQADSVADLVLAMQLFGKSAPEADSWFIAVGHGGVVAVANDCGVDPRLRHEVRFSLCRSGQFAEIEKLAVSREGTETKDLFGFIRFLRVKLGDAVPAPFLQSLREMRYSSTSKGRASVHTGAESLGAEVLREATLGGADPDAGPLTACRIPDEVTMDVNVYEELPDEGYAMEVRCIVDVRFEEAGPAFSLIPVNGELSRAERDTNILLKIAVEKALQGPGMADVGVFCGSCLAKH